MPNLPIIAETIPDGSCPATYNELAQLLASRMFAVQGDGVGKQWIFSATKPTPEQALTYAWYQIDTNGVPIRPYVFAQGAWLSPHPLVPGMTMWLFQDIPDITVYDGGDGTTGPVSPITGPMWQLARTGNLTNKDDGTIIAARFPIVGGTLPSTTVLDTGDTGGEETHALTEQEIPPHTHGIDFIEFSDGRQHGIDRGLITTETDPDGTSTTKSAGGNTDSPPVVVGHNNMPPYVVGIMIQRTNRTHYLIPG